MSKEAVGTDTQLKETTTCTTNAKTNVAENRTPYPPGDVIYDAENRVGFFNFYTPCFLLIKSFKPTLLISNCYTRLACDTNF